MTLRKPEYLHLSYADLSNAQINEADLEAAHYTGTVCLVYSVADNTATAGQQLQGNDQSWHHAFQSALDYTQCRQTFMTFESPHFSKRSILKSTVSN